ncbi:MAG: DUF6390 family protein [Candidatus Nealsonbacteria bacterium]
MVDSNKTLINGIRLGCLYSYGCNSADINNLNEDLLGFAKSLSQESIDRAIIVLAHLDPYKNYQEDKLEEIFGEKRVITYWLGSLNCDFKETHNWYVLLDILRIQKESKHNLPDSLIQKLLDCSISYGKVIKILEDGWIVVRHFKLVVRNGKFSWEAIIKDKALESLAEGIEEGDFVSIHLEIIREKISEDQIRIIEEKTRSVLENI